MQSKRRRNKKYNKRGDSSKFVNWITKTFKRTIPSKTIKASSDAQQPLQTTRKSALSKFTAKIPFRTRSSCASELKQ